MVAAVDRRAVALASTLDPLDWSPADELARPHHEGHVGIAEDLRPEGAADVRADAADLVLRDARHEGGQEEPLDVRGLARHPDRVFLGPRVVEPDVAPDLHRVRDEAMVYEPFLDDDLGLCERLLGALLVADGPVEHDVVRGVVVELRRAGLGGLFSIDHGRERLVVDLDRLECVDRLLGRLGDDGRHPLARPLDRIGGENAGGADVVRDARRAAGRPGHGQRIPRDIGPDDGREHARHRLGRGRIDRADVGVRVWATQDGQMGHRLQLDVVEVAALAGDEARVLDPLDGRAEDVLDVGSHRCSPPGSGVDGGGGRGAGSHQRRRLANRGDDVVVARAAADVALDRVADLFVARVGVAGEEVGCGHDHAGCAEPALEAVLLPESLLEWVKASVRSLETLDRRHARPVGLDREHRAALDRLAIDGHRARAALARVAADMCAGQLEVLAQELDEHSSGLDIPLSRLSVDDERDVLDHVRSLLPRIRTAVWPAGVPGPMRGAGPWSVASRVLVHGEPLSGRLQAEPAGRDSPSAKPVPPPTDSLDESNRPAARMALSDFRVSPARSRAIRLGH